MKVKFFLIYFFISLLYGDIHVFNRKTGIEYELKTLRDSKILYVSIKDIAKSLSSKLLNLSTFLIHILFLIFY